MSAAPNENAPRTGRSKNRHDSPESKPNEPEIKSGDEAERKPSWRDFYAIHPAAEFYHKFSSAKQLKELTDDIDKQQVIFEPIHTATVFGKTFVIDGISRLDAAETTGRQIVDEKGNWIGVLDGHVVHHPGKTDEQVWDIVSSLNLKRRHLSKDEILEVAKHMLEHEAAEKGAAKNELAPTARSFNPTPGKRGGSTKDPYKAALHKRAEKIGGEPISKRKVEEYLSRQPDRPKSTKGKSEKLPKTKTKPEKVRTFEDKVWRKWSSFLRHWSPAECREVKPILREFVAAMSKHWPQSEGELEIFRDAIRKFMAFMARNEEWSYGEPAKEALKLIPGWIESDSNGRS